MKDLIVADKSNLITQLWKASPWIYSLLNSASSVSDAREKIFEYFNELERTYFNVFSELPNRKLHITDRNSAKESIRVFKNILRTENEVITKFSAVKILFGLATGVKEIIDDVQNGFLLEMIYLFHGISGKTGDFAFKQYTLNYTNGEEGLLTDSNLVLDQFSSAMKVGMLKFKLGNHPLRKLNKESVKQKLLTHFVAVESDWLDYRWHLRHKIQNLATLSSIVKLEKDEIENLTIAEKAGIPFQITPYYLSLFNENGRTDEDRVVRAQVLPGFRYCQNMNEHSSTEVDLDLLGEKLIQPVEGISRKYPQIVSLRVFDSCPQICVYCQKNRELREQKETSTPEEIIKKALNWISEKTEISEVMISGGEPLLLSDEKLESILRKLSAIGHVERIRIGTRMLVTLPSRITTDLVEILSKYNIPGKREVCLVTHFEHVAELTGESIEAVTKIRRAGMSIYNQQVFTYYNSRRYETSALRRALKLSGIDPYYTFNTKGKKETVDFRVPIARLEQERKEEARFLPGLVRTDEPVFSIPRFGKSHLRSWQDHEVIMVLANGGRVYRFFPWQSRRVKTEDYLYTDVAIYDYLQRLHRDGEEVDDYSSIWFYY
jgi:lysine 2,3-aminomutase